jgi:hypothetical protein
MNRKVTFENRSILSEALAAGESLLATMQQNLKTAEQMEPGEFRIAQLAKYEEAFAASVRQIEESQSFFKRMIEAKTEEEFDAAQVALASFSQRTPEFAYAKVFRGEVK